MDFTGGQKANESLKTVHVLNEEYILEEVVHLFQKHLSHMELK